MNVQYALFSQDLLTWTKLGFQVRRARYKQKKKKEKTPNKYPYSINQLSTKILNTLKCNRPPINTKYIVSYYIIVQSSTKKELDAFSFSFSFEVWFVTSELIGLLTLWLSSCQLSWADWGG